MHTCTPSLKHACTYTYSNKLTQRSSSPDKNHVVYLDNFFTSVKLVEDLEVKRIFCAGTIRTNKLHVTPELVDKGILRTMQRGDSMFRSKRSVILTVWKDNKDIHLISNAYPTSGDMTVPRKRKVDGVVEQVPCPPVVPGYNSFMGGVEQNDQMKSYYAINRRSRRWWLRLFWHFLDIAMVNAHCLYIENRSRSLHTPLLPQPPMDGLAVRCSLIHTFCDGFTTRKLTGCPLTPLSACALPVGIHGLVHVSTLGMLKGRCHRCSLKGFCGRTRTGRPRKRKETFFAYSVCCVRLCKRPCYDLYHR